MSGQEPTRNEMRSAAYLLCAAGAALLIFSLAYNELLLQALQPDLDADTRTRIRLTQAGTGALALLLAWAGLAMARRGRPRSKLGAHLLLLGVAGLLPLLLLEASLRPFADLDRPTTTLFLRDEALGWRLRPGATDVWGDVPVTINNKGLRGPELDYAKPAGAFRILFLGDSVTFGYRLESDSDPYPFRVAQVLGRSAGRRVQGINAGVGGWSPWQQLRFLEDEGVRYDPDLVVLGFVLNDVTEKFRLIRFGGATEGFQLAHTAGGFLDFLSHRIAMLEFGRRALRRLRFGSHPAAGAVALETAEVRVLAEQPGDPEVVRAWGITLENVEGIRAFCEERQIPLLVAIFPYTFQFYDPEGFSAPQRTLAEFLSARDVAFLDLMPALATRPWDFFMDRNHLTAEGMQVVAEALAAAIEEKGWLEEAPGGVGPDSGQAPADPQ